MSSLEQLDRAIMKREALMERLAGLDPDFLTTRPAPDSWSITEVVEHMVLGEEGIVGDFSRLPELPERRRGFLSWVGIRAVIGLLRFKVPLKVPFKSMIPRGETALPELDLRWADNHARLRSFVAGLDPAGLKRTIFRHPVSGPLTVEEGIRLLDTHLDRHMGQISRIERDLGSRGASGGEVGA
jgi:uncharacterized damage-inducible protein DinB